MMKVAFLALLASTVTAFSPQPVGRTTTSIDLFGSRGGAAKKGPGMMDQLAMFKKAQEVAAKKAELDKELQAMDFEGEAEGGNVVALLKYVPIKNPMDPNPDYDLVSVVFDDAYFEEASPDDLSAAVEEAYKLGIETCNAAVMEKYQTLTDQLSDVFGKEAAK